MEWIESLSDSKAVARIFTRFARLRAGNFGDVEPVGAGVSELKIDYGPGYRVYIARHGREIVVLLVGGTKKRQPADIVKARDLWEEYKDAPERFQRDF